MLSPPPSPVNAVRRSSGESLQKTRICPGEKNPLPVLALLSSRQSERNHARSAAEGFWTDSPELHISKKTALLARSVVHGLPRPNPRPWIRNLRIRSLSPSYLPSSPLAGGDEGEMVNRLKKDRKSSIILAPAGKSSKGRTHDSGSWNLGSNPGFPASFISSFSS